MNKKKEFPSIEESSYKLHCGGLDYEKAPLEIREKFSFTKSQQEDFYLYVKEKALVRGLVLLSTCNRLELYVSQKKGGTIAPFSLICAFLSLSPQEFSPYMTEYVGEEVFTHLCHLSSGLKSQIFGEDQIITQVKLAQKMAREFQGIDSFLEVVFRLGITCGKKIRTSLDLAKRDTSMSKKVVEIAKERGLTQFLVIGNGEMARHVGEMLVSVGATVFMSVRSYRHSEVSLPKGVVAVSYSSIYHVMPQVESVVSATLSPHFTVNYTQFSQISPYPNVLFDLAVPRDIDMTLNTLPDVVLFNVDDLSQGMGGEHQEYLLEQVKGIVVNYQRDLNQWVFYSLREEKKREPSDISDMNENNDKRENKPLGNQRKGNIL